MLTGVAAVQRSSGGGCSPSPRGPMAVLTAGRQPPALKVGRQALRERRRVQARATTVQIVTASVKVNFKMPYHCRYGQSMALLGSEEELGGWDVSQVVRMDWSEGDLWLGELNISPKGGAFEYKYVVVNKDGSVAEWKPGENIRIEIPPEGAESITVADCWDGKSQSVEVAKPITRTPEEERAAVMAAEATQEVSDQADDMTARLSVCLKTSSTEDEIEECLMDFSASDPEELAEIRKDRERKFPDVAQLLDNMCNGELTSYVLETVTDEALVELDEALMKSFALQDQHADNPAAPEVLAADRMVAAAAKRAIDMTRALDTTKAAALLANPRPREPQSKTTRG